MALVSRLIMAAVGTTFFTLGANFFSAEAAIIRYRFDIYGLEGPLAESYESGVGFFNYDDSTITGTGFESVPVSDLSFLLDGVPQLTGPDCCNGQDAVELVSFSDGELFGLSYGRYRTFGIYGQEIWFGYPALTQGSVRYTLVEPGNEGEPPASVPEPSTAFGFSVLGLSWLLKKKVKSQEV